MAQNPKAKFDAQRNSLRQEIKKAAIALSDASQAYGEKTSLSNLRAVQVATDAHAEAITKLREYDGARSTEAVRKADSSPKRAHHSWPVGKPYDPTPPRRPLKPQKPDTRPPLTPHVPRPTALQTRVAADGERIAWWVGVDDAQITKGAQMLAKLPPSRTASPVSKATMRKDAQKINEQKRSDRERLSGQLQDRLKPMSGAFGVIPTAD